MPTKLLIVESLGKVKKLSQILGSDWLVRASMGHIRELANDGIDPLGFDLGDHMVRCRFTPRGTRGKETIAQLKIELSPEYRAAAWQWLTEHDPDNVPKKQTSHRQPKDAQEAHEAIRPTEIHRASAQLKVELSSDEFALYVLIRNA